MHPPTQYARSGDLFIAYQVFGEGPFDLVFAPGWMSHVEQNWEWPDYERFLKRLAGFCRVIPFDRRGTGLSDRITVLATFEEMMDDIRAVMDAVGSERAALFGGVEGGAQAAVFAATHPDRTSALIFGGAFAKRTWAPDYPWAPPPEAHQMVLEAYEKRWGRDTIGLSLIAPDLQGQERERFGQWLGRAQRYGVSPGAAIAWYRMTTQIDVRHVLPAIHVPTLVLHRVGDRAVDIGNARYLAEHIAGARLVELPGSNHFPFIGDVDRMGDEIEEFLTGSRRVTEADRILATVLFTDIVGSTQRAADLGDRRWREVLDAHDAAVRRELERHRGREVKTTGDGVLATFDGPARAIRCAVGMSEAMRPLGIDIRAGLHTGECEVRGEDVGGIAVHIGARVASLAAPGEVLVSSTVKDLVIGSEIRFADRGAHPLKGVPGEWRLYAVER
jgi:class 3 adenylate cyclase